MTEDVLNSLERRIQIYIAKIKTYLEETPQAERKGVEFDIRGDLYHIAMSEVAPVARIDDIRAMRGWIQPKMGEVSIDLAAGAGFLTKEIARWTDSTVYAVDYSQRMLQNIRPELVDQIRPIVNSLAQESGRAGRIGILDEITESIDFITSFGGLHHVYFQRRMMQHVEKLLKSGGRFVAADVGAGTSLAYHFDDVVARKCLTGHTAKWLSEERLRDLISLFPSLSLEACEIKTQKWVFDSTRQMALFFKGLHAYEAEEQEIVDDLYDALGFEEVNGQIVLHWPMLFFRIIKK